MFDDFTGLLKFSATWCGPCKTFAPVLAQVQQDTGVVVKHVDIDDESDIATKFSVRSVPTTLAMKNGKVVDMIVGAVGKDKVLAAVSKINNNNNE